MQGETNYVSREYNVAAILLLLFMVLMSLVSVLNLLYFYISTFRSMCAVPNFYIIIITRVKIQEIIIIIIRHILKTAVYTAGISTHRSAYSSITEHKHRHHHSKYTHTLQHTSSIKKSVLR